MDKKLKNLKHKQLSEELAFTPALREKIYQQIEREKTSEQVLKVAVLEILSSKMTGYELLQKLVIRGIKHYEMNEGELYLLLHQLEKQAYLLGDWKNESEKTYVINKRGRKYLKTLTDERESQLSHQNLRGDYLYE